MQNSELYAELRQIMGSMSKEERRDIIDFARSLADSQPAQQTDEKGAGHDD